MVTAFVLGRIIFGLYWVYSGVQHFLHHKDNTGYAASKKVPAPAAVNAITGIMMLLGGLAVLLGAWVGVGLALLIIFLVGTLVKMHDFWNETDPMARMMGKIQFTKNLALIGACLMMYGLAQPWIYSLGW